MKLDPIRSAPAAMEAQNNKLAWVYRPVLEFLNLEATAKAPLETGGILMGYFGQSRSVPVILRATGPGPRAVHLRDHYRPDPGYDESQIATIYRESGGLITYLGDWHTHLTPFTGLSRRDRRTLRRIARCKSARVEMPLMLILSYDDEWELAVWQGRLHRSYIWSGHLSTARLTMRLFTGDYLNLSLSQTS